MQCVGGILKIGHASCSWERHAGYGINAGVVNKQGTYTSTKAGLARLPL